MKSGRTTYFLLAMTCLTASVGCGDGNKAIEQIRSNLESPELIHTWNGEHCSTTPRELGIGGSYRVQYEFAGTEVKRNEQYYSSPDCKDIAGLISYSGTFKKQKEIQKKVHELDMEFTKVTVTALNETGKKLLNTIGFCDKADWQVNQPVDLSAKAQERRFGLSTLPDQVYDIVTVEDHTLFFGKGDDKNSVEKRPIELDREKPLRKA